MFPIDFSTIFPSISSPLSPQGDIQTYDDYGDNGDDGDGDDNVDVDGDGDGVDDQIIRTGGGEGRGPMEILFLITVLLGGWLGVVARLIIARYKYSHRPLNVISRMIIRRFWCHDKDIQSVIMIPMMTAVMMSLFRGDYHDND